MLQSGEAQGRGDRLPRIKPGQETGGWGALSRPLQGVALQEAVGLMAVLAQ